MGMALNVFDGQFQEAMKLANEFFAGTFQEQITAEGEQPFEAVRTRPLKRMLIMANMASSLKNASQSKYSLYSAGVRIESEDVVTDRLLQAIESLSHRSFRPRRCSDSVPVQYGSGSRRRRRCSQKVL